MNAEEIRRRVLRKYQSFETYQDSGTIKIQSCLLLPIGGEQSFRTNFVNGRVDFEWNFTNGSEQSLFVLAASSLTFGFKIRTWLGRKLALIIPKSTYLNFCLGSTDVSAALAKNPKLPTILKEKMLLLGEEVLDGVPCFKVREYFCPNTIWISKHDFMIKKIRRNSIAQLDFVYRKILPILYELPHEIWDVDPLPPQLLQFGDKLVSVEVCFESVSYKSSD